MRWYNTSLGKKYIMGISGLIMVGFVIVHMLGNLTIFGGAAGINTYAESLRAFPPGLWAFRLIMLAAFVIHIYMGISLYLDNKSARPNDYAMKKNERTTFSALTMIWTGLLLAAFVVYHVLHFTVHAFNPEFETMVDPQGRFDVFDMAVTSFHNFGIAFLYVAAMVVLLLHLRHGIQSFFQSLGWTSDATFPKLSTGGRWVAGIVAVGFVLTPVLIYFNVIGIGG